MSFLLDFPRLKAYCAKPFLTDGQDQGWKECYIFAVTLIESRPLLFTIHTDDGAVYSRIPLQTLRWEVNEKSSYSPVYTDQWGAISGNGTVIQHTYLKDYVCELFKHGNIRGRYWCTIDYYSGGFAQDPEQHKTSNIILLNTGHIVAVPNNEVIFKDDHFVQEKEKMQYKTNKQYYFLDGVIKAGKWKPS